MIDLDYCRKWRLRDKETYRRVHINETDDFSQLTPEYPEIVISGLNQERFEHFCTRHADRFEIIHIEACPLIRDLSPLQNLRNVRWLLIDWNQKATALWDMSKNIALRGLLLRDMNKISSLDGVEKAPALAQLSIGESEDVKIYLDTLAPLASCEKIERLEIGIEGVRDESAMPITKMKSLKEARFGLALFETEQFAMLAARLENVKLQIDKPYFVFPRSSEGNALERNVRVVGKKKPWLSEESPKLKQYENEWNALVEKYKQAGM
jgi:hypothetical protein